MCGAARPGSRQPQRPELYQYARKTLLYCGWNAVLMIRHRWSGASIWGRCPRPVLQHCTAVRAGSSTAAARPQGTGERSAAPHPKRRVRKVATASVDSACRLRFLAAAAAATMSAADSDGDAGGWAGGGWAACGSAVSTRLSGVLRAATARRAGLGSAQRPAQANRRPCEFSGPTLYSNTCSGIGYSGTRLNTDRS